MMVFDAVRQIKGFGSYCAGNGLSIFGTGLWCAVLPWYVWRHTGSAADLGWLSLTTAAPLVLCAAGGFVADRFDRRKILIVSQVVALVLALLLTRETLSGHFNLVWLLVLNAGNSLVTAFEFPARQAFKRDIAGKEELVASTVATYMTVDQVSFMLGQVVAGSIIALTPICAEWICAVGNTISFLGALWALAVIRPLSVHSREETETIEKSGTSAKDCLCALWHDRTVFTLLLHGAIIVLFGMRVQSLLPTYASEVHNQAELSGLLLFMVTLGAMVGPLLANWLPGDHGKSQVRWSQHAVTLLAFILLALVWTPNVVACFVLLAIGSMLTSMQDTCSVTGIQVLMPQHMLGRILGWRGSLTWTISLFAAPAASHVAAAYGTRITFTICAGACLLCGWLACSARKRRDSDAREDVYWRFFQPQRWRGVVSSWSRR